MQRRYQRIIQNHYEGKLLVDKKINLNLHAVEILNF